MPLYFYTCDKCMKMFEVMVPIIRRDETIECPHCKETLRREVSAPQMIRVY